MPLSRAALWLRIGSVVLFLAPLWLLLVPGIRWIPATQFELAKREWLQAWESSENSRSRLSLESQIDLSFSTAKTPREQVAKLFGLVGGADRLEQVRNLVQAEPDDPMLLAASCRALMGAMREDYRSARHVGNLTLFSDRPQMAHLAVEMLTDSFAGRAVDRNNAFFPLMRAVAFDVLGNQTERDTALHVAAGIDRCDSYAMELAGVRKRLLDEQHPYRGEAEEALRSDFSNDDMWFALRSLAASLVVGGPSALAPRRDLAVCALNAALDPSSKHYELTFVSIFSTCLRSLPISINNQGDPKPNVGDAFGWELRGIGQNDQAPAWGKAYLTIRQASRELTNSGPDFEYSDPLFLNQLLVVWFLPIVLLYLGLAWLFSRFKIPNFPYAMHPGLIAGGLCTTVVLSATYDVNTISEFSLFAYVAGSILVLFKRARLFGWIIGPTVAVIAIFVMKDVAQVDWFLSLSPLVLYGVLAGRYFWQLRHPKKGWLFVPGLLSSCAILMAFMMVQPIPWQSALTILLELIGIGLFYSGWQQISVQKSFTKITRCWPLLFALTGIVFISWSLFVKYCDAKLASDYEWENWSKGRFLAAIKEVRDSLRPHLKDAGAVIPILIRLDDEPQWQKIQGHEKQAEALDSTSKSKGDSVAYIDVDFLFRFVSVDSAARFLNWVQAEGLSQIGDPKEGTIRIRVNPHADLACIRATSRCLYWISKLAGGTLIDWEGQRKVQKDLSGGF